jgi:hypothetical protein
MNRSLATLVLAAVLLALLVPDAAQACAMCMAGQGGGTSRAFAIGSIFLSITPLASIGALVWYIRRRARALAAEEEANAVREMPFSRSSSSR